MSNTLQAQREAAQDADRADYLAERAEDAAADRESYLAEACACSCPRSAHVDGACAECDCSAYVDEAPPSVLARG